MDGCYLRHSSHQIFFLVFFEQIPKHDLLHDVRVQPRYELFNKRKAIHHQRQNAPRQKQFKAETDKCLGGDLTPVMKVYLSGIESPCAHFDAAMETLRASAAVRGYGHLWGYGHLCRAARRKTSCCVRASKSAQYPATINPVGVCRFALGCNTFCRRLVTERFWANFTMQK
eukprot:193944-Pyramimonas_sp.AAC.1